ILDHTKPNVIEFNPNHPASLMEGYPPIVNLVCNEEAFHYPMDIKMRLENGINLSDYVPASKVMVYQYDLGDDWRHKIEVKNIIGDYDNYHPICLDGNGDAPPEDVGGEPGYDEFVEAIADPEHSEHDHLTEWVKYNFSYRPFDLPEINRRLEDAKGRLSTVLLQLSHLHQMFNSIIIFHRPRFTVMRYITQTCVAKLCFSSDNLSTGNLG